MNRANLKYLTLLLTYFVVGQNVAFSQKQTNFLQIEVVGIDTVRLLELANDTSLFKSSNSPENTLAQVVHFKVLEKNAKQKTKTKNIIVTELTTSEHICPYGFRVGQQYKLPIYITKYSSELIKKELQGWHYRTSCWNMPTTILENSYNISFKK